MCSGQQNTSFLRRITSTNINWLLPLSTQPTCAALYLIVAGLHGHHLHGDVGHDTLYHSILSFRQPAFPHTSSTPESPAYGLASSVAGDSSRVGATMHFRDLSWNESRYDVGVGKTVLHNENTICELAQRSSRPTIRP